MAILCPWKESSDGTWLNPVFLVMTERACVRLDSTQIAQIAFHPQILQWAFFCACVTLLLMFM